MKKEEVEDMLSRLDVPQPGNLISHTDLKIPLLSYKRSSRAGLWLLILPLIFAITVFLKTELGMNAAYLHFIQKFFAAINDNQFITYLIPVIFIGLPLLSMVLNLLAICHFERNSKTKELIITIKYRPLNIAIMLFSFALLVFFLLPDKLSF